MSSLLRRPQLRAIRNADLQGRPVKTRKYVARLAKAKRRWLDLLARA